MAAMAAANPFSATANAASEANAAIKRSKTRIAEDEICWSLDDNLKVKTKIRHSFSSFFLLFPSMGGENSEIRESNGESIFNFRLRTNSAI